MKKIRNILKMKKVDRRSSVFYAEVPDTTESDIRESDICYEGYLKKSPPLNQFGVQSSWKTRYFVLAKRKDEHILNYYKTKEERKSSSPQGYIPIKTVTELCIRPEDHPKWYLLQKMFKCISGSVILLKTKKRDYFFIGEIASIELFRVAITRLLHMEAIPQPEEKTQDSFGELAKAELHLQPETSSPNKLNEIYATIPEILAPPENIKGKSEAINPGPHVEPTLPEMTNNIYDVPRKLLIRWSEPRRCPVNTEEKPRSYSLPTAQLKDDSATSDKPRNVSSAKHRVEKTASIDSGYMSMASIRDSTGIDWSTPSKQIKEEEENYCNVTKSGILVADDVFLTKNQYCPLQSPHEHPPSDKSDLLFEKRKPLTEEHLKTLLSNVTEETKLEKLDVTVRRDDIKNNLSLRQVNDKVCVAYSEKTCMFNHGDHIVAINKLQINDVKELNILINKSMEEEVTATILRLPEVPKFHSEECNCDMEK